MKLHSIDRRLVKRVQARWQDIERQGRYPSRAQIVPDMFGDDWPHCFIVDLDPKLDGPRLLYVGETIRDPGSAAGEGQPIAACEEGSLLHLAVTRIPALMKRGAPISFGGYAPHGEGHISYRSILLPLAEDGHTIDGVLAAINHREAVAERGLHAIPLAVAV